MLLEQSAHFYFQNEINCFGHRFAKVDQSFLNNDGDR